MDLLHAWWLFRLLFVFLLACPFLIIPVLRGVFRKRRDGGDGTDSPAKRRTQAEVSGRGTWILQADGSSQSSVFDESLSPIERHAA